MGAVKKSFTSMAKPLTCKDSVSMFYISINDSRQDKYIPPKKPYSFEAMLDDILNFAASYLVDYARLSLWMPTANDEEVELGIPTHPCLDIVSICVQPFNKCKLLHLHRPRTVAC